MFEARAPSPARGCAGGCATQLYGSAQSPADDPARRSRELGVVHFPDKRYGTPQSRVLLAVPRVTSKVTREGLVCACAHRSLYKSTVTAQ